MTPSEIEALAKAMEILSKVIGTVGFPVVVTLYLLLGLPKQLDKIMNTLRDALKEVSVCIDGMRSDIQELSGLLKYEAKLRSYEAADELYRRKRGTERKEEENARTIQQPS